MSIIISGPGVGLPYPMSLYPGNLNNAPQNTPANFVGISPGDEIVIPSTGTNGWIVDTGAVCVLQWLDPITGIWRTDQRPGSGAQIVTSDGFTRRIANLTGCPVGAAVTGGGSGYAQATATITPNIGGSTWQAIVGGALSISTIAATGANYTMAPLVHIPVPPNPGIQATAYAVITSGTVSSVSLQDFGAGYISAPTALIIPNPADPNYGTITTASITLVLNAAQSTAITGALLTNNGAPITSSLTGLTLTATGGAGSGATLAALVMQCITAATVTAGGGGWGNAAEPPVVTTAGGYYNGAASVNPNPMVELTKFRARPGVITVTASGAGLISAPVVQDPGLFVSTPSAVIIPGGALPTTLASVTLTLGGFQDTILLQPL